MLKLMDKNIFTILYTLKGLDYVEKYGNTIRTYSVFQDKIKNYKVDQCTVKMECVMSN